MAISPELKAELDAELDAILGLAPKPAKPEPVVEKRPVRVSDADPNAHLRDSSGAVWVETLGVRLSRRGREGEPKREEPKCQPFAEVVTIRYDLVEAEQRIAEMERQYQRELNYDPFNPPWGFR